MTEKLAEEAGCAVDIEAAEQAASEDVVAEREEALAKKLSEMKKRKRTLVDPLQYEMSIQAADLANYTPAFGWECEPPTEKQKTVLKRRGYFPMKWKAQEKPSLYLTDLTSADPKGLQLRNRFADLKVWALSTLAHGHLKRQASL